MYGIFAYIWLFFGVNVGIYIPYMDGMGYAVFSSDSNDLLLLMVQKSGVKSPSGMYKTLLKNGRNWLPYHTLWFWRILAVPNGKKCHVFFSLLALPKSLKIIGWEDLLGQSLPLPFPYHSMGNGIFICVNPGSPRPNKVAGFRMIHIKDSRSYQWAKFGRLGLPGWMVDFYSFHVGKYRILPWMRHGFDVVFFSWENFHVE